MPLALFDLDDTLIDHHAAFRAWAEEFSAEYDLGSEGFDWLMAVKARYSGTKDRLFSMVRDEFELAEPADLLWEGYRRRIPELATCRSEDLEALQQLRRAGWRIGIVTNGMADNQSAKIHRTGLAGLADAWCISDEVGIRKPDPRIFRLAAQRCGMPADDTGWMVGDSLTLDVAGGRAAGLRTVWINPSQLTVPSDQPGPDFAVASVADAVQRLLA
ncbi:HAD family hydrolase [Streptomyces jeddahensis]|uniref:Pyrimidine 5'-nucleotidase YjjG n=1 Tax=Streptomyces jeddahensis TaxID=1716141 RepID=A0A177HZ93_9ACTN|nr:HAD family hydrolase [Streptomyces jeddahensis]OAH16152.1 pyrimidine 5'-nucleotidase YjjG [Streptomyces jeddahensis]